MISLAPPPPAYIPTPAPQVIVAPVQNPQTRLDSFAPGESHWVPPTRAQMMSVASAFSTSETRSPQLAVSPLRLPAGFSSLERLSGQLSRLDSRFDIKTPEGRSANALALAIGGTEVYGRGTTGTDFFTRRGGTGNNMQGFAQFNLAYHRSRINTPQKYAGFLANMLYGQTRMPNSKSQSNHVKALNEAVSSGQIRTGGDLRRFMAQRGFGGSNWQGIDDGWGRNPGLADALVNYLRQSQ